MGLRHLYFKLPSPAIKYLWMFTNGSGWRGDKGVRLALDTI
jgi:hypothetical protein